MEKIMAKRPKDEFEIVRNMALHTADSVAFAFAVGCGVVKGTFASNIFSCVCAALCLASGVYSAIYIKKFKEMKNETLNKMFQYEQEYTLEKD